ncbi:ArsR/SmtB family transcription factor [Falsibacillus pallidus]|uniref:ArsR family transcriptional regulator n=1 Tax=Falsibacillus pallidus TaxID=493781 RepID=A0A370GQC5_9BACI|nr:helix-turn-helix domain-containing protein [Falsibacillus pallidus]RDI45520.1 ArsR family transcriptional regulator [Falsibacillus pallidus]
MKKLNLEPKRETVALKAESSPVWEVILGIAGFTYKVNRHTFHLNDQWIEEEKSMDLSLLNRLEYIEQTNLWYGMIMLQNKISADSIDSFIHTVERMEDELFFETLLPYHSREAEGLKKESVSNPSKLYEYTELFQTHIYLYGYLHTLLKHSNEQLKKLIQGAVESWYEWVCKHPNWEKWMEILESEQKEHSNLETVHPSSQIEHITGGAQYEPEPGIWIVKMIPQISYRPWLLELRTMEEKLFFYPVKEEYFSEPGVPSSQLVQGHKALGDGLRLSVLYELRKGSMSLQEMSRLFQVSKTTLHHQLSLLRGAKFIRVDKGIYSINMNHLQHFSEELIRFIGEEK